MNWEKFELTWLLSLLPHYHMVIHINAPNILCILTYNNEIMRIWFGTFPRGVILNQLFWKEKKKKKKRLICNYAK